MNSPKKPRRGPPSPYRGLSPAVSQGTRMSSDSSHVDGDQTHVRNSVLHPGLASLG